ncbi:MAG: hypothetical protein GY830_02635 [Bacteroidetes bacterium]|nr:hypothetical protein [Bacteroidota bacterium]
MQDISFKKEIIYIKMLEGIEVLIPVEAKLISKNLFEIIENRDIDLESDATSIYEFFPGDIVSCIETNSKEYFKDQKKDLNFFFLANKLISSNFPNRKLYELIFIIVKRQGEVRIEELEEYKENIHKLCTDKSIFQRNHPVIKAWIEENCHKIL